MQLLPFFSLPPEGDKHRARVSQSHFLFLPKQGQAEAFQVRTDGFGSDLSPLTGAGPLSGSTASWTPASPKHTVRPADR